MDTQAICHEGKLEELKQFFGPRLVEGESKLLHFTKNESFHKGPLPWALFKPQDVQEVIDFVKACARNKIPIIPYGAGTSLEGHTIATNGGVILDMTEMCKIVEVNAEDQDCVCQPGVMREALNSYLRDTGLFFPIDPGADASIGGMVATSASGTNAVRYGTMKENVLALKVVMADGSVIRTGTRARKSAAGLDLNHLLIGSEGTLGVITEVTLRLHARPECTRSLSCSFSTIREAVDAVICIIQLGIPLSRIEFMDEIQVTACNELMGVDEPVLPTLLMEFHGTQVETNDQSARSTEIIESMGGKDLRWAGSPEESQLLWSYRHNALPAAKLMRPGCEVIITDVCVPISRLSDCVVQCKAELDEARITAPIVGHVGDGNFHTFMLVDPDSSVEIERAEKMALRMANIAIEMGGTSTGEHGIGIGKQEALVTELGENTIRVMRTVKSALDPDNIMNPGKIFSM